MSAKKLPPKTYADFVLENGEIARVEVPEHHVDNFFETVDHLMKRKDWLSFNRWDGCTAELFGLSIERLHMARVVAML